MSAPDGSIAQAFPRLTSAGRYAAAIICAGTTAAMAWLFILQEGHTGSIFGARWTQHDFPNGLANAFGAHDTLRVGLYLTLGLGVIVAVVFALIERRLPGRGLVKGLWFAALLFLAWGLLFTPLVNARQVQPKVEYVYLPTGLFGFDAGDRTIISGIVGSVIAGLVVARIIPLMRDESWWQAHPEEAVQAEAKEVLLEDALSPLFELPEERTEQGGERAR